MKSLIVKEAGSKLTTRFGVFYIAVYNSIEDNREHVVLTVGDIGKEPVLVRIHSKCLTGDVFFSKKCDCRDQLSRSMEYIQKKGKGVILYLDQEGRGIGLANKIKAYALQEEGLDTVEANHALGFPADARDYSVAAEILKDLKISSIILLTNNPDKLEQLSKNDIKVVGRVSLETTPNKTNKAYLATKKKKLGHYFKSV